ncbi:MAG: transposase [Thermaerobacter sp.]|nr:transposase [Thermaerobacter sp.]
MRDSSFARLHAMIQYKSMLKGIEVVDIEEAYTSSVCPICGGRGEKHMRTFTCPEGHDLHRDIVGAVNIRTKQRTGRIEPSPIPRQVTYRTPVLCAG